MIPTSNQCFGNCRYVFGDRVWAHLISHAVGECLLRTPADLKRDVHSHLRSVQRTPTRLRGFLQKPSLRHMSASSHATNAALNDAG